MYLVYEVNYLPAGDCDFVEESDFKLYHSRENAIQDMNTRRDNYMANDENVTYMENESNETRYVFADHLKNGDDREGEFHICLCVLDPAD